MPEQTWRFCRNFEKSSAGSSTASDDDSSAWAVDSAVSRSVRKKPGSTIVVWTPNGSTSKRGDSTHAEALNRAPGFEVRGGFGAVPGPPIRRCRSAGWIDALFEGSPPILERDALRDLHMVPAERYWRMQDI